MRKQLILSVSTIVGLFLLYIVWIKFSPLFSIYLWKPDFNLIVLVSLAQVLGRRYGLLAGAYLGLMEDFSTSFFGYALLAKSVTGFIAGHYFKYDEQYNFAKYTWGLLLCALLNNFLYMGLYYYGELSLFDVIIQYMIPEAIYTSILGLLIYFLLERQVKALYVSRKLNRL